MFCKQKKAFASFVKFNTRNGANRESIPGNDHISIMRERVTNRWSHGSPCQ